MSDIDWASAGLDSSDYPKAGSLLEQALTTHEASLRSFDPQNIERVIRELQSKFSLVERLKGHTASDSDRDNLSRALIGFLDEVLGTLFKWDPDLFRHIWELWSAGGHNSLKEQVRSSLFKMDQEVTWDSYGVDPDRVQSLVEASKELLDLLKGLTEKHVSGKFVTKGSLQDADRLDRTKWDLSVDITSKVYPLVDSKLVPALIYVVG